MKNQPIAVYIRIGSKSYGFCLPDDREAFKTFMNQPGKSDARTEKHNKCEKPIKTEV